MPSGMDQLTALADEPPIMATIPKTDNHNTMLSSTDRDGCDQTRKKNNKRSRRQKRSANADTGLSSQDHRNHNRRRDVDTTNGQTRQLTSKQQPKKMSDKKLSHSLSWALRHAAPDIGLTIRADGYVPVNEILRSTHPKLKGATLESVQRVVETSDKKRFKLEERPIDLYYPNENISNKDTTHSDTRGKKSILCIRANQGHSIKMIDPELLLTKLSPEELRSLPCIVHGTSPDAWESIQRNHGGGGGLKKMNRTHIHFASGLPTDEGVISGMRKNSGIYIYLDALKCAMDNQLEFYTSDNGVILTSGIGTSGVIPMDYFSHVTDSSGRILLDNRAADIK